MLNLWSMIGLNLNLYCENNFEPSYCTMMSPESQLPAVVLYCPKYDPFSPHLAPPSPKFSIYLKVQSTLVDLWLLKWGFIVSLPVKGSLSQNHCSSCFHTVQ